MKGPRLQSQALCFGNLSVPSVWNAPLLLNHLESLSFSIISVFAVSSVSVYLSHASFSFSLSALLAPSQ